MTIDEGKARNRIQSYLYSSFDLYELVTFGSRGPENRIRVDEPSRGVLVLNPKTDTPCECVPLDLFFDGDRILNIQDVIGHTNRLSANSYTLGRGTPVEIGGMEKMVFPMAFYRTTR